MSAAPAPVGPQPAGEAARRRGWGWLLLVPGMLWLAVFFLFPTIQLFFTSLYDPSGYTAAQGTSFAAPMVAGPGHQVQVLTRVRCRSSTRWPLGVVCGGGLRAGILRPD